MPRDEPQRIVLDPFQRLTEIHFPSAHFCVVRYTWYAGNDLDTRTKLTSPNTGEYLGWGRVSSSGGANAYLTWYGDNLDQSVEAVLIDLKALRDAHPDQETFTLECRAFWYDYDDPGSQVELSLTFYPRGTVFTPDGNHNVQASRDGIASLFFSVNDTVTDVTNSEQSSEEKANKDGQSVGGASIPILRNGGVEGYVNN